MSARPYDPWCDADGTSVPERCRIEQIAVAKLHGAMPSRLGKRGEVIGRGSTRLHVRFDDEDELVSLRPYLVRVMTPDGAQ